LLGGLLLGLWAAAPAAAQTPTTSMMDVRLATELYEMAEGDDAEPTGKEPRVRRRDSISIRMFALHQKVLPDNDSLIKKYRDEKNAASLAVRKALGALKKAADSTKQAKKAQLPAEALKRQVVELLLQQLRCAETHAPDGYASAATVTNWYTEQQTAAANIRARVAAAPALTPDTPVSTTALEQEIGKRQEELSRCRRACRACVGAVQRGTQRPLYGWHLPPAGEGRLGRPARRPNGLRVGRLASAGYGGQRAATGPMAEGGDDGAADNSETVAFAKGLGEALYTGARFVPAVTIKADVTNYGLKRTSAFIGSVEVVGLNDAALKFVDSSATRINYLHPEISSVGAHLTLGYCKRSRVADKTYERAFFGILWRGSYLRKNLSDTAATDPDKRSIGTDHLMSNLTAEYVLGGMNVSFFAGYTYQEAIGNRTEFKRLLGSPFNSLSYFNGGIRARLNVGKAASKAQQQNISIEVSFIQVNDRLATFLATDDPLIPVIRVGFAHRLFDNLDSKK
ncbi:MAG: hypothetical protein H7330_07010, partial [Hymenobacteraceae bacterium]|nr:hypothetical protein [Hymenobacteraceae bacterium]